MEIKQAIKSAKQVKAHWGKREVNAAPIIAEIEGGKAEAHFIRANPVWKLFNVKREDGRFMTLGVIVKRA